MIGLATGFALSVRLSPEPRSPVSWLLATGTAIGVVSLSCYAWLWMGSPGLWVLFGLEAAGLAGALAIRAAPPRERSPSSGDAASRLLWMFLVLAASAATLGAVRVFLDSPNGLWDAVEIWNLRARMFVRGGLDPAFVAVRHADYPLLVPLAVTELWAWLGEHRLAPMAISALFGAGTAGLLFAATDRWSGRGTAVVVTTLYLAAPFLGANVGSQRADIPLSFFMLAGVVCLGLHAERREAQLLTLAGIQLGCAAWTKNEGVVFAALACTAWAALSGAAGRRSLWRIALGAGPFLLALAVHKLTCGSVTDLIAGQQRSAAELILDWSRYAAILESLGRHGAFYIVTLLVLGYAFAGRDAPRTATDPRLLTVCCAGMLLAYGFVYLMTPHELDWHLGSSLDRLLLQIWPIALLRVAVGAGPAAGSAYST